VGELEIEIGCCGFVFCLVMIDDDDETEKQRFVALKVF
jgi:hypothetical protein